MEARSKIKAHLDQEHGINSEAYPPSRCRRGDFALRTLRWLPLFCAAVLIATVPPVLAQNISDAAQRAPGPHAAENAEQVANILGISQLVNNARLMRAQTPCEATATVEELSVRQDILETVVAASLEVDGVLAELDNERAHLSELSAALQARRDRSVNLINIATLLTGTGVGIAVNALQFSSATANIGNALGVGSGIGSTVLSIIGIRQQHGPQHSIGRIPNMLAPLFDKEAALNSYYPQAVQEYLRSVPPGQGPESGSRLDQLMAEWKRVGRIGPAGSAKTDQKITRLTSSLDTKTKLSIDDLSDRVAMLGDVTGRVGLMKRDLAELMLSIRAKRGCMPQRN